MSCFRFALPLAFLWAPGCALFGDPLLGTWELLEADAYGPLTTTTTDDNSVSTTTSLAGVMVLDTLEDGDILGSYTETTTVTLVGPEVNDTTTDSEELEAEAFQEGGGEYTLDIDGFGDWLCQIQSATLDCEDDDGEGVVFERVGEGEK